MLLPNKTGIFNKELFVMRKVFLTTLLVIMMGAASVLAAGWEQIYTDDNDNMIYFDPATVRVISMRGDETTFSAAFCMRYSERGRNALIDWYRDYSIVPSGIENLSYDVTTIQFKKNGDMREYYISERVSYTENGTSISTMHFTMPEPLWVTIPIGSLAEVEYNNALLVVNGQY